MSESYASAVPPPTTQAAYEPMRGVLAKLLSNADTLSPTEKTLATTIRDLGLAAKDPVKFNDTSVQRTVANAAQSFERATGKQLELSPEERSEVAKYTAPNATSALKTEDAPKSPPGSQPTADPLREVLSRLVSILDQLPDSAKALGTKIRELDTQTQDPVRLNQRSVQHEIAYLAQDFEKALGKELAFTPSQRGEVAKLSASAPSLENERMSDLLRNTGNIADNALVGQIRRYAAEVGQAANQTTPEIQSRIERLESSARVAARVPEPSNDARTADATSKTNRAGDARSQDTAANGAKNDQPRSQNGDNTFGNRNGQSADQPPATQSAVLRGGILDTLTSALRGNGQLSSAPWDPQPTPFGDRLNAYQQKVAVREQDRTIAGVEKSARVALEALDGFRNAEGAAVMNRIQAAAKADPGGVANVLTEMREGGKFGDLRQAFSKAMNDDKGFAEAYDRAAGAVARYGEGREKVEQIIAKRPDAANLIAKFEDLDNKIGERASSVPSRNEGKNMLEDISRNIAEILTKATEAVLAKFTRNPTAGPSASPAA